MAALLMYLKVRPEIAIPLGLTADIVVAYMIAQLIRSFQ